MNVLHLTLSYPPAPTSGVAVYIRELSGALQQLGVDSSIAGVRRAGSVRPMDVGGDVYVGSNLSGGGARVEALASVRSSIKRPSLVHVHETTAVPLALELASEWRCPVVFTRHGIFADPAHFPGDSVVEHIRLARRALVECAEITCVSEATLSNMREVFGPSLVAAVSVIGGGTHHGRLVISGSDELPRFQMPLQILFAGRLVRSKGVDIAMRVLAAMPRGSVRLTVAGHGPERAAAEDLAASLGVSESVEFCGWVSRENLRELYRGSDIVLVPSRVEPFGLTLCEGQAAGRVVVASDVDGIPERITHGATGLMFAAGDVAGAVAQLDWVISNPDDARAIARQAASHARKFYGWDVVAKRMFDVYSRAFESWHRDGKYFNSGARSGNCDPVDQRSSPEDGD